MLYHSSALEFIIERYISIVYYYYYYYLQDDVVWHQFPGYHDEVQIRYASYQNISHDNVCKVNYAFTGALSGISARFSLPTHPCSKCSDGFTPSCPVSSGLTQHG